MIKVIQRVELNLRSFYIFNSTFGCKEGQESEKILYYYPQDIELNTKIKDVGLSEAIISFTGTFTSDDDCKALHTQKTTQLFYQPEKNFWMVMVINVPKELLSKDGIEVAEYKGSEVQDDTYRTVLVQCYKMFRLFAGSFEMILNEEESMEEKGKNLQKKLELFYNKHLVSLKLPACDVFDAMQSLQYLPLNKFLFMRVHNFLHIIQATFTSIIDTIFIYKEQIVCSKLNPYDLYCLHESLIYNIFTESAYQDLSTGFLHAPGNAEGSKKPPMVYIMQEGTIQSYSLVIYRSANATLCLLIDAKEDAPAEFYTKLHSLMGEQLASIASDIDESLLKSVSDANLSKNAISAINNLSNIENDPMGPKYLFINEQSLKYISNIYTDRCRPKANSIPAIVMNLIADLFSSAKSSGNKSADEVQIKTTTDYWIVKKSCNWRQFYVVIFNSKATLLDVINEACKIFEQEITDDVFFDK